MDERGYNGDRSYNDSVDKEKYFADYMINQDGRCQEVFGEMNLEEYPSPSKAYPVEHTVFTSSNRGGIHRMFLNEKMRTKLDEIGMNKYSAFRCTYAFLFRENAIVESVTEPYRKALLAVPSTEHSLRIGIGIRVGDETFDPNNDARLTSEVYLSYTRCAENLEKSYFEEIPDAASHPIPWYVMAESLHTRRMVAQHYKTKVVTDTNNSYFHGDCAFHVVGGCEHEHLKDAIVRAASQLQLFAMCNVHIIAGDSGFPRIGSFLAKPPHHILTHHADCKYGKFQDNDEIMTNGAGIRV
jgi:hypothetical protein